MLITNNLESNLGSYKAETLLSRQDLYHLLEINSTKIAVTYNRNTVRRTHERARRHLAHGLRFKEKE